MGNIRYQNRIGGGARSRSLMSVGWQPRKGRRVESGSTNSAAAISIELRGLEYAFDERLVSGSITVQRTSRRVRRVEGTAVVMSPVAGEATVVFELVSLPQGYREDTVGTIRITDAAANIDVTVDVELSEDRGYPIEGVGYPDDVERPCIERELVGVRPAPGVNAASGAHRGVDAEGEPFVLVWTVDDGGAHPDLVSLRNVRLAASPGFGSDGNVLMWAMETFRDALFVATCNWRFERLRDWEMWAFSRGPIESSEGTEIWRLEARNGSDGGTWTRVVHSGLGDPYNHGIRNLLAVGEHLYAVTVNHTNGFEIWRTEDGETWSSVMTGGFGNSENTSGRGIEQFGGHLYVGTENKETGAEVWRAPVERAGNESEWERVLGDDVSRSWYAELTAFDGHLYAGTLMTHTGLAESDDEESHAGCRVLRSQDGVNWEIVVDDSFGDSMNNGIISMVVFDGRLYIGTSNTEGGEVHASADGVRWERCWKGAGAPERNWHAWKLCVYNDRLYLGLGRLERIWWSGLGLVSTADGREWIQETDYSLVTHYGMRSMKAYRGKLYLGTASFPDCGYVLEAESY